MIRRICLLLCVTSFFVGCNRSPASRSDSPTLKETTDWINDTYNRHGVNWSQLMKNGTYQIQDERMTSLHVENCVATVEGKQRPGLPLSSDVFMVSNVQTLRLVDIEPIAIEDRKSSSRDNGWVC
jgi:hypothetical protein